jgi:hypothetical protein
VSTNLVRVGHHVLIGIDHIPSARGDDVGGAGVHHPHDTARTARGEELPRALDGEAVEGEEGPVAHGSGGRRVHVEDSSGAGERRFEGRGVGEVDGVVAEEGGIRRGAGRRGAGVEHGDGGPATGGCYRGGEVPTEEGGTAERDGAGKLGRRRAGLGGRHHWAGRKWDGGGGTRRNGDGGAHEGFVSVLVFFSHSLWEVTYFPGGND